MLTAARLTKFIELAQDKRCCDHNEGWKFGFRRPAGTRNRLLRNVYYCETSSLPMNENRNSFLGGKAVEV